MNIVLAEVPRRLTVGCLCLFCWVFGAAGVQAEIKVVKYLDFEKTQPELYRTLTQAIEHETHVWDDVIAYYRRLGHEVFAHAKNPLLETSDAAPNLWVVVASIGGDGEHSPEHSFVFEKTDTTPRLIAKDIPYFISDFRRDPTSSRIGFSGEYVISFCRSCDGAAVASPEDIVAIPVQGIIDNGTTQAWFSGGPYLRWTLLQKLSDLWKGVADPWLWSC